MYYKVAFGVFFSLNNQALVDPLCDVKTPNGAVHFHNLK